MSARSVPGLLGTVLFGLLATGAWAHPMGNFSINQFSGLELEPGSIRINYIVDMAEIPAFQEMQAHRLEPDPGLPNVVDYQQRKVRQLMRHLEVKVDDRSLALELRSSSVSFPTGEAGLSTLRIGAVYEAPLTGKHGRIEYEDHNYRQRIGWKEIIAIPHNGMTLTESSVAYDSRSNRLTAYDKDLVEVPPKDVAATLVFVENPQTKAPTDSPGAFTAPARESRGSMASLDALIPAGPLDNSVIALALLAAVGLGAFHALEPGHGKTLVAAYLVGARGTARHALLLGLIVTASHTAGVYALGGITLFASQHIVPERLYPWLGLTSGMLVSTTGALMLRRALQGRRAHRHPHSHAHPDEPSRHLEHHDKDDQRISHGALWTLGVTGGLVPCPAALVVLLSTVALQQARLGLLLIVAFSTGLAAVLIAMGLLVVYGGKFISRSAMQGRSIARALPVASASVVTLIGLGMAVRSLAGVNLL